MSNTVTNVESIIENMSALLGINNIEMSVVVSEEQRKSLLNRIVEEGNFITAVGVNNSSTFNSIQSQFGTLHLLPPPSEEITNAVKVETKIAIFVQSLGEPASEFTKSLNENLKFIHPSNIISTTMTSTSDGRQTFTLVFRAAVR